MTQDRVARNGHDVQPHQQRVKKPWGWEILWADTPDYCGADHPSGKPATRLAFVPLDDFLGKVRRLERALHHALGGPRGKPESICVAVHRLLTR